MMICDWKTGRGYREICTDVSVSPDLVARINLPDIGISK